MARAIRSVLAVPMLVALGVAACTSDDVSVPGSFVPTTTTEPPTPRIDDEILRIGTLLPQSDTLLDRPLLETFEAAVNEVNDAGGVLGNDVELFVQDEGATDASAALGIERLLDRDVDAIIGPSSSLTAIGALDDAVAADIVTCSPTATALSLDEFPDDRLFFRTIASDSLQAIAIAEAAEVTGARNVAIVHTDDAYGRPYAAAVGAAADQRPIELVDTVAIPVGDDDLDDDVRRLLDSGATVAIVLGSAADTARFLTALASNDFGVLSDVIVNDAARDTSVRPVIADLPDDLRTRITGLAPMISVTDEKVDNQTSTAAPFAPQAIDCVNLIALAALQGRSDSPTSIATQMPPVSDGGRVCRTFATCAEQLRNGAQIDYEGPTGVTELNREGESSRAVFETFSFDPDGIDQRFNTFRAQL